jgi:hypothetical protein
MKNAESAFNDALPVPSPKRVTIRINAGNILILNL